MKEFTTRTLGEVIGLGASVTGFGACTLGVEIGAGKNVDCVEEILDPGDDGELSMGLLYLRRRSSSTTRRGWALRCSNGARGSSRLCQVSEGCGGVGTS